MNQIITIYYQGFARPELLHYLVIFACQEVKKDITTNQWVKVNHIFK